MGPIRIEPARALDEALKTQRKLNAALQTLRSVDEVDFGVTEKEAIYREDKLVVYRFKGDKPPTAKVPILIVYALVTSARCRSDFVVQRSGDIGSPRSSGSTNARSAATRSRSCALSRLRPPPARRTRPTGSGSSPESNSSTPRRTVVALTAAASATARTPPWPNSRASVASANRC